LEWCDEAGDLEIKGTLDQGSDFNRKENIIAVSTSEVLKKIMHLPISEWQYKGQDIRHLGPMAQDFYKAFGLGQGETTIATVDADGVSLAAIKALAEENQNISKNLDKLKLENQQLKKQNQDILSRLTALEASL